MHRKIKSGMFGVGKKYLVNLLMKTMLIGSQINLTIFECGLKASKDTINNSEHRLKK